MISPILLAGAVAINLVTPPQSDPLTQYDASRRLAWSQGSQYTSDAYAWYLSNTESTNRLWLNGAYASGESGTNDLGAAPLWNLCRTSSVIVAVVDSRGFDTHHPDLGTNVFFATNLNGVAGAQPVLENHGTQVAGVIGAAGQNGIGTQGICWSVPLLCIQYRGVPLSGHPPFEAEAIDLAVDKGAQVICLPTGVSNDPAVSNALVRTAASNVVVVCSALNAPVNQDTVDDYPTTWRLPNVLTVCSTMRNNTLFPGGSGYGHETVFCGAPGRRLPVLTAGGGYGFANGTSEASGIVAGVVALVRTRFPDEPYQMTKDRLAGYVTPGASLADKTITGGVIDFRALSSILLEITVAGHAPVGTLWGDNGSGFKAVVTAPMPFQVRLPATNRSLIIRASQP